MPNLNFVPRNLRGVGNSEYGINMKFTDIAKTAAFAAAALSSSANENLEWKPFGTSGSIGAQISENGEMSVSGKFGDASAGFAARANLEPSSAYILKFLAAADTASGGIISGTKFINKSFWQNGKEFSECETVFATTSNPTPSQLTVRLGGWNADGRLAFKNAEILEYFPVSASPALSPSESLKGGFYRCDSQWQFGYDAFQKISTGGGARFNENRWVIPRGADVVFEFEAAGLKQRSAEAEISVCHNPSKLSARLSASTDGEKFVEVAEFSGKSAYSAKLPQKLFPAKKIFLKIAAAGEKDGAMQINMLKYRAAVGENPPDAEGKLAGELRARLSDKIKIERKSVGPDSAEIALKIFAESPKEAQFSASFEDLDAKKSETAVRADLQSGWNSVKIPLPAKLADMKRVCVSSGAWSAEYRAKEPNKCLLARDPYGARICPDIGGLAAWETSPAAKLARSCPAPKSEKAAISVSAAANEREAVQLAFRPQKGKARARIKVSDLENPETGAKIPAENVDMFRVGYVPISNPTDALGEKGDWPDPLFRMESGEFEAAENSTQPVWLRFFVPPDAQGGTYRGELEISAGGESRKIPVTLRVYGFRLPDTPAVRSAVGAFEGNLLPYYKDPKAARGKVAAQLGRKLSEAGISPYNALAPEFRFEYPSGDKSKTPKIVFNWKNFDQKTRELVEKFRVNAIQLRVEGIGGGSFHTRTKAKIREISEGDPRYEETLADYLGQIDRHIVENGWENIFYTYTFDEPEERDYPFVKRELGKIKRYAPNIKTMLTEHPAKELEDCVDIWCPVTREHSPAACAEQIKKGKEIWWYICMQPRAPYVGIFVDHPGIDLRAWLWQSFKYDVSGILIWSSTYMSSRTAYPDRLQNPYFDPMSWATGYGLPEGTKNAWGNGDGRLFYPPESLARGEPAEAGDEAVGTMRLEMLREGVEDYGYLAILKNLLLEKSGTLDAKTRAEIESLLSVPESITASMTEYSLDQAPIQARRGEIADAIEKLK